MALAIKRNGHPRLSEQLSIDSAYSVITDLETKAFNIQATKIYVDQLPWRTTATKIVKDLGLAIGQGYQSQQLSRLLSEKEERLAMNSALAMLTYRSRSCEEIARKLGKRGISSEVVTTVIKNLESAGYLNDKVFAKTWIEERVQVRGLGRHRIKKELLSKGVDPKTVDRELENIYGLQEEEELALSLAKTRLSKYVGLDNIVKMRRLGQVLLRRGFSPAITQKVLREII